MKYNPLFTAALASAPIAAPFLFDSYYSLNGRTGKYVKTSTVKKQRKKNKIAKISRRKNR